MSSSTKRQPPSHGDRNIAWIEGLCVVLEGRYVGKPVILRPWQPEIIQEIYNSRRNGKTALFGMILLLHLVEREARPNNQLFSTAQFQDHAAILFALAAKIVRLSPHPIYYVAVPDMAKQLYCTELDTLYWELSVDALTAHGLSPVLVVHDEIGQVKGPRSPLYEALETASAAHDDPLSNLISTQAATDADLSSVLIDDAKIGVDPKVKLCVYTADYTLDPFSEEALQASDARKNPSCF